MSYNELIEEKRALDNRINALHSYVSSDNWLNLSEEQQDLIRDQLVPMTQYSKILGRRIGALEGRSEGEAVEVQHQQLPESKAEE